MEEEEAKKQAELKKIAEEKEKAKDNLKDLLDELV